MLPSSEFRVLHIAKPPTNFALFPVLVVLVSMILLGSRGGRFGNIDSCRLISPLSKITLSDWPICRCG